MVKRVLVTIHHPYNTNTKERFNAEDEKQQLTRPQSFKFQFIILIQTVQFNQLYFKRVTFMHC